ncbi:tyrosine-type recombinase/integrase [Streptomyces sp. NPDC050548]|uniref:tyrosine-type recombinase/integrase n=1 Tax=Streptomyces sp. NPDC050548 TaxID=3365629 RepID=UPI0037AA87CF
MHRLRSDDASSQTPTTCRTPWVSWLVHKEGSLYEVQHLLGHESFQSTQHYTHLQPDAHKAGSWRLGTSRCSAAGCCIDDPSPCPPWTGRRSLRGAGHLRSGVAGRSARRS